MLCHNATLLAQNLSLNSEFCENRQEEAPESAVSAQIVHRAPFGVYVLAPLWRGFDLC